MSLGVLSYKSGQDSWVEMQGKGEASPSPWSTQGQHSPFAEQEPPLTKLVMSGSGMNANGSIGSYS